MVRDVWILALALAAVVAPTIPGSGEGRGSRVEVWEPSAA